MIDEALYARARQEAKWLGLPWARRAEVVDAVHTLMRKEFGLETERETKVTLDDFRGIVFTDWVPLALEYDFPTIMRTVRTATLEQLVPFRQRVGIMLGDWLIARKLTAPRPIFASMSPMDDAEDPRLPLVDACRTFVPWLRMLPVMLGMALCYHLAAAKDPSGDLRLRELESLLASLRHFACQYTMDIAKLFGVYRQFSGHMLWNGLGPAPDCVGVLPTVEPCSQETSALP